MASPLFRKVSGSGSGSETAGSSFAKTTLLTPMSSGTATPITATSIAATEPTILRAPVHKSGSVIPTPDGGMITVRPYRSNSTNQMKALVTFTPRPSGLDRFNEKASGDQFRGFYSLFWIGLFLLFCRTSFESWEANRTLLSTTFGHLITRDALVLAISDFIMVASMLVCVPFVKALQRGTFRYYWTGVIIQHIWQTAFLSMAVWWGYHRQWYWVQAGFLVLHALSSLMKMHSWCAHNGMLSDVYFSIQAEEKKLKDLLETMPDRGEKVCAEAEENSKAHEAELARKEERESSVTPIGTPMVPAGATAVSTSYITPGDLTKLRLRGDTLSRSLTSSPVPSDVHPFRPSPLAQSVYEEKKKNEADPSKATIPLGTSLEPSYQQHLHPPRKPDVLSYSSNSEIAQLAKNIDLMKDELKSNGEKGLVWPENVTYKHFLEFMCFPTLCYQLEYPRTTIMRPMYVLEKVFATFGVFSLIYLITEHYIMPFTPKAGDSLIKSFVNLALPMVINYLLIFYIIFECICNAFAELTYFADREFYQDWWNSVTWDQFARKWNKPVHTFLLRHVYASSMSTYQLSKKSATFVTFLLSALVHELVMAVVSKKFRLYLFGMQMAQLPMIAIGRIPAVRRNKTAGNIVFWLGLMMGFPLLAIAYLQY